MEVILTNHAKERMKSREINFFEIEKTINQYDRKSYSKDTVEYYRKSRKYEYKVITKISEKKCVVISVWVDPPLPGSFDLIKKDRYRKYQKSSLGGKIWMQIKRSLFGWEF